MILVFGGTTEGRKAAEVLEEAGSPFYYSTKTGEQELTLHHGERIEVGRVHMGGLHVAVDFRGRFADRVCFGGVESRRRRQRPAAIIYGKAGVAVVHAGTEAGVESLRRAVDAGRAKRLVAEKRTRLLGMARWAIPSDG